MKTPPARRLIRVGTLAARVLASAIVALLAARPACAANVTWDISPGTVGTGDSLLTGGAGAWDEALGNWSVDAGANNIAWVNANNDVAIFGDVAGTVTLSTDITVGGLTFNDNADYLVTGKTLTFGAAGAITTNVNAGIASAIAGSFAITKTGTGTLTLSGTNIHDGGTTVNAGTLTLAGSSTLGATSGGLTVTGATTVVDLGATAQTLGTVSLKAGSQINNGTLSAATFAVENGAVSANLAGTGATTLTKTTTGTVSLSGSNTYEGVTAISAGTLHATQVTSLPNQTSPGFATVANAATLRLNVGGAGEFAEAEITAVLSNATFNSATAILGLDTTSDDFTFSPVITKTLGLTKFGPNTLTLTGAGSTLGGSTLVSAGTLAINGGGTLVAGTPTYVNFGSTLTVGDVSGTGVLSDTQFYIGSAVGSDNNSVTVTGAGSKLLRGTGAGSGAHRLYLGMASNGGPGGNNNTLTIADGGYVYSGGSNSDRSIIGNRSHDNKVIVTDVGSQWRIAGNNLALGAGGSVDATDTLNSLLITNGGLVTMGSRQCAGIGCALNANNNSITVTGTGSTWNMGTGQLNVGGAAGNLAYNAASNVVSYNNSLTVTSGGVLSNLDHLKVGNFAAANNNSVAVQSAGLLEINLSITMGAAGSTGNTLTVDTGGILQFKAASPTLTINTDNSVIIDSATLSYKGVTGVDMSANQTPGVAIGQFTWSGNNTLRLDGSTETGTGTYTFANNLGPTNFTGLELLGTTTMTSTITMGGSNGGTLRLNGANSTFSGGVTLNGPVTLTASGTASALTGVISGSGALTKAGAATLTLNSANDYNGNTTVGEGTLKLTKPNASNESSTVSLANGAVLDLTFDESAGEVTDTVSKLFIGATQMPAGIYGASGSGADPTHTDDTHFAGNGTLTVTSGGTVSTYDIWATAKGLNSTNSGAGQDPDNDGANNLAEFAFDGDPLSAADGGLFFIETKDNGDGDSDKELTFTCAVRRSALAFAATPDGAQSATIDGVTYTIEGDLDLSGTWDSAVSSIGKSDTPPAGSGLPDLTGKDWEYRTFSAFNALPTKGFLRAKVTQP
jgi:autotransporter-associated beta strand protein